jgi:hypothetical protein
LRADNRQEIQVALYLRQLALVEIERGAVNYTILIRQVDSLLLTTPSLYKAQVRIGDENAKLERFMLNPSSPSVNVRPI